MKDKLKFIWDWGLGLFVACIFIFAILAYYFSDSSYMIEDPYVYNYKYYHKPTKAQLFDLMDELTNHDAEYNNEYYFHKGMPADDIKLRRYFSHEKVYEIIDTFKKNKNIILLENEHYCLGEINIIIKYYPEEMNGTEVLIYWGKLDKCRMYWWEGKNPRALQAEYKDILK